jgi:hypothetical protein
MTPRNAVVWRKVAALIGHETHRRNGLRPAAWWKSGMKSLATVINLTVCLSSLAQTPSEMGYVGQTGQYGNMGVIEFNATTGTAVNPNFIFTGLNYPEGLAVSGNNLFATNPGNGTVGLYNATTGAAINTNFITGLNSPCALALSANNLFILNYGNSTVGQYDVTTGAAINVNLITLTGLYTPGTRIVWQQSLCVG